MPASSQMPRFTEQLPASPQNMENTPKEDISLDYELGEDAEMLKEERRIVKQIIHKGFKKRFKTDLVMNLTLSHSY